MSDGSDAAGDGTGTGDVDEPTDDADGSTDNAGGLTENDVADALAWETTERRVAYECPGFDVVHDDVVLPDGTETEFDYLSEDPAVVVLPFTPDGDVVVIEEWRQAVGRVNRGVPAGGVEGDDADLAMTVHRELTEETGYEADGVEFLLSVEPSNGLADSVHHYFAAHGCTPTGAQDLDFNETIRVAETSLADLRAAVREGECRDGRTALAVSYYEAFGTGDGDSGGAGDGGERNA